MWYFISDHDAMFFLTLSCLSLVSIKLFHQLSIINRLESIDNLTYILQAFRFMEAFLWFALTLLALQDSM